MWPSSHWADLRKCEREREVGVGACGKACVEKSPHNILPASLALTFGVHACLHAPFNASAVIKSLIKLMSNPPGEPGVDERYDCEHHQPSASSMLMSQPISPNRPSVRAEPEQAFVSRAHGHDCFPETGQSWPTHTHTHFMSADCIPLNSTQ